MEKKDICVVCGVSAERACFNRNVEGKGINLCGKCGVDYQVIWRPENSPIEPNVGLYVLQKKMGRC